MKSFIKFLIGLAALPVAAACAAGFVKLIRIFDNPTIIEIYFIGGFAVYFLVESLFSKPLRTYVLGHELSHVFASLLCGGVPKKIKVSKRGGSVTLSKSNFFISLAPYMFPIYTVAIILVYFTAGAFYNMEPFQKYFAALMGLSIAFHIRLTVFAVLQGQPDIKTTGIFFSAALIISANFVLMALLFKLLFPAEISVKGYLADVRDVSAGIYFGIYGFLEGAARKFLPRLLEWKSTAGK